MVWIAVFLAAAAAGTIQSITGFGAAVMMMLVVPHFFDMVRAPGLVSTICLGLGVALLWRFRKHVEWKVTLPVAAAYVVLSTLAIRMVGAVDLKVLAIAFSIFLILLSLYYQFGESRVTLKPNLTTALVCGTAAGITGGLFGIGGPLVVLYFLPAAKTKESYVANLQLLFTITNLSGLAARVWTGIYTIDLLPMTLVGVLGINLGKMAGLRVLDKLDIDRMRRIVYVFVGIAGVVNLVSNLL